MEETINCPVCGEPNPADEEFCGNCQSRLRPLPKPIGSDEPAAGAAPSGTDAEGEIPQWLRDARLKAAQETPSPSDKTESPKQTAPLSAGDDLLAGLAAQTAPTHTETPAWVARITGISQEPEEPAAPAPEAGTDAAARGARPPEEDYSEDEDDSAGWRPVPLEGLTGEGALEEEEAREPEPPNEVSDWLRRLDEANAAGENGTQQKEATPADVPDWVSRLGSGQSVQQPAAAPDEAETVPDWLQSAPFIEEELPEDRTRGEIPAQATPAEAPAQTPATTQPDATVAERQVTAPFTGDESLSGADVDQIFASMEMPDWLADVNRGEEHEAGDVPPSPDDEEPIGPVELPSWVEAMRPIESVVSTPETDASDLPLEQRGPLLGLHGVLPAVPGAAAPSSRPRAQSLKIDVTEQQKTHAALLEAILSAESTPVPMQAAAVPAAQRLLRWVITAALLIVVGAALFAGSQVFPLPSAVPNETVAAVQAVQNIPEGAPVLAVFDYEPATMGEMEAAGASLMDHLLLLKHPRLTLISTSPTGSVLAERFMSTTLVDRAYQRGSQYVNLGYLPGGLTGVYAFAQNPLQAAPLGADADQAWNSDVLRGVQQLSDFAAIVVLTDSLESGRAWIEQTALRRASGSLIVVSSAQVGPMLLPYVDSGQVSGLVSGVNGAVGAEQANGGLPGYVRRYWDAYSLGTYLAAFLIVAGGAWYLILGIRERRMQAV